MYRPVADRPYRCRPWFTIVLSGVLAILTASTTWGEQPDAKSPGVEEPKWRALFDGKSLDGWQKTPFGGEGEVKVEDGNLILGMGFSLTGVTYTGELPHSNYEVELDAKRVEGIDFFCGLTFPVKDSHCSFIVGGWAGGIVGLSSIDGKDASENETTRFMGFKTGQWYHIRLRVTDDLIEAWIDDDKVVHQRITDRMISTRPEVNLSKPFGFATWETKAALRNIRLREIEP